MGIATNTAAPGPGTAGPTAGGRGGASAAEAFVVTRRGTPIWVWGGFAVLVLSLWGLNQVEILINNYVLHVLTIVGINVILVAGLNIINGYLGEFAIGHAGFMAVGAYVASVATVLFQINFFVALALGMAGAALVGYLVAIPAFKTFGDYLAIVTLGFNMIIVNVIQNIDAIGGPRGLGGMPRATNFLIVAAAAALTVVVIRNLVYSNWGRVWVAIRENDIAAEMMGVNVMKYKVVGFTVAALFAGLAGGLLAHLMQYINPSSFTYIKTTDILVMLYLGGMGSMSGSIVGATALTVALELLRPLGVWRMVVNPLILIMVMLTRPVGIMGNREFRFIPQKEEIRFHDEQR